MNRKLTLLLTNLHRTLNNLALPLNLLKEGEDRLLLPLGRLKDCLPELDAAGRDLLLCYLRSIRTNLLNGLKGLLSLDLLLPNLSLLLSSLEDLDTNDPRELLLGLLKLLPGFSNELSLLKAKLPNLDGPALAALNGILSNLNAALDNASRLMLLRANLKNTLTDLLLPLGRLQDGLLELDAAGRDLLDDSATLLLEYLRSIRMNLLKGLKGLLPLDVLLPNLSLLLSSLEDLDTDDPGELLLGLLKLLPDLSTELSLLDAKLLNLDNTKLVALNGVLSDLDAELANDLGLLESLYAEAGSRSNLPLSALVTG